MAKKWIQGAIKHPGALKAKAKAAGALTSKGTIEPSWLSKKAHSGGKTGKQALLAQTLKKMH